MATLGRSHFIDDGGGSLSHKTERERGGVTPRRITAGWSRGMVSNRTLGAASGSHVVRMSDSAAVVAAAIICAFALYRFVRSRRR